MERGILHTSIILKALPQVKIITHEKIQVTQTPGPVLSPGVDELSDLQTTLDTDTELWFAHMHCTTDCKSCLANHIYSYTLV